MNDKEIQRKLWDTQIEILDVIDKVCRGNDLHYSLYAGSLLGAVRHQGFIPWDDDLDICMSREDYERFLEIWKDEDHPGYLLQNKRNTSSFTQSFSKIRKDHTAFVQYEWEKGRYHTGIFVDIFPIDRSPASSAEKKSFQWKCMKYQLYTREFVPPKASAPVKVVSKLFLSVTSEKKRSEYRRSFEEDCINRSLDKSLKTIAIETVSNARKEYPADLLNEFTELSFEGKKYQCFAKWDEFLTLKYGDYMKLPPEEERVWTHHPLILDFEHNYEEIK